MCSNMSSVATHTRKFFSGFGVFVFLIVSFNA